MPVAAADPYSWSFHPQVVLAVAVAATAYGWRLHDLRLRDGPSSRDVLRAVSFGAGLAVLLAALVSPIDSLGEERLFSVHMVQHILIMDVAPILLLLGLSRPLLRPLIRRLRPIEERLGYFAHPVAALIVMVGAVWFWHLPALYELALENPWAHQLEHLTFLLGGLAFWWYVIEPVPPRHRLPGMWPVAYVAAAKLLLGGLGLVLAFAPSTFYETYENAVRTWGLTALEDQNVGGLVMMLEQSILLTAFFAFTFVRMLERSEQTQRRRERLGV
jgi:cytochrome c oxidase assembly factor CtaG